MVNKGTLIVLVGPTGIGKTELSLSLAEALSAPIISADSRQLYKELPIGTAAPTQEEQRRVPHYMVGVVPISEHYSAARYESEVIPLIEALFRTHRYVLLVGGSMLYIDAITKGIDDIPDVCPTVRQTLQKRWEEEGLDSLLEELRRVDLEYYNVVDKRNHKRVIHGLEVYYSSGKPFSSFRTHLHKKRSFDMVCFELVRPREELYNRINDRVRNMLNSGWLEEARSLYAFRHLNALNTIGYKELFQYIGGMCSLDDAIHNIARNTRIYARKQMTWFKKTPFYIRVPATISCRELIAYLE